MVRLGRASWLQSALREGDPAAPAGFPEWSDDARGVQAFEAALDTAAAPESWAAWTDDFLDAEERLHGGTALWADTVFYRRVARALERWEAPPEPRRVVALLRGVTGRQQGEACDAAVSLGAGGDGEGVPPALVADAAVVVCLAAGRPEDGERVLDVGRAALPALRVHLLEAALRAGG